MMRIPLFLLAVTLAVLPTPARGVTMPNEILFQYEQLLINSSVNNFDATQFDLDFVFLDNQLFPTNPLSLFDDAVISVVGGNRVFESTATDPNFSSAVNRFTDASAEFLRLVLTEDEPGGLAEQRGTGENIFFLNGNFPNPILFAQSQLASATIERFQLEVTEFSLSPTGSAGPEAPIHLLAEFTIYGTPIPEPSTIWLLGCGLATLGPRLLRRRRLPRE